MRRKYVLMSSQESESKRAAAPRPRTQSKAKPLIRQALRHLASSPDSDGGAYDERKRKKCRNFGPCHRI